jgi:superfamily II RNA helicase
MKVLLADELGFCFGVERAEEINLSAAATAESWAGGMNWEELVFRTKAEEGDLVRLLSRTGEALRQIARQTAEIILREPIK